MTSMRLPPTFMPGMPCSQPSITPPVMFTGKGWFREYDESKISPVEHDTPM